MSADRPPTRPPARLEFLFARTAPVAAILRTGPTRQTRLIRWDLRTDSFEPGQWVRHKVYADRSCLSPDGRHLLYFSYKYHLGTDTMGGGFTTLSRLPWFEPIERWVQVDTWGGGARFIDDRHILLHTMRRPPAQPVALPGGFFLVAPDAEDPDRFLLTKGQPAPIAPEDIRQFHAEAATAGTPPAVPEGYEARHGCLYRRDESGHQTLLCDFNAMEFEVLAPPY